VSVNRYCRGKKIRKEKTNSAKTKWFIQNKNKNTVSIYTGLRLSQDQALVHSRYLVAFKNMP